MDVRPIVAASLLLLSTPAGASPFVAGEPQPLSVRIAASRAAVTARPAAEGDPQAGWAVVSVLHDATGTVRVDRVVKPRPAPPADTRAALLISNGDATVDALPLSEPAAAYVAALPALDAAVDERFDFAARHLADPDELIAGDAFAELARLRAADFDRLRDRLPREALAAVVADPETPGDRVGLYGYLLGLCGEPADAARLRRRLLTADGVDTGAAGLAAGYLLLSGEAGLADLEANVLMRQEASPLLAAALFEAFAFFRAGRRGELRPESLRRAACSALARGDTADLAVGYLAAGREWTALPQVAALLRSADPEPDRRRAGQVSAVRFFQECRRDADAPAAVREAAARMLSQVAANDPDLARRATALSGGPDERR